MFKRRSEAWTEAASLLGAEVVTDGAIRGELDGYSFIVSATKETKLGGSSQTMVCRVDLPDLPGGVSIVPRKAWLRWWGPLRRRFVVFDDPGWDNTHAVRAVNHQVAAAYLTPDRRRAVMHATMNASEGEDWFQMNLVLWRLDPAVHGLEVHMLSVSRTPQMIAKGVRATIGLAKVLDPKG